MNTAVEHGDDTQPHCSGNDKDRRKTKACSRDTRLDHLLQTVVTEVKLYAFDQISQIKRLTNIGIALSAEKNINRLLEKIVNETRNMSGADAGRLCIVNPDEKILRFEILQNDTVDTRMGGTSGVPVDLPPVPLQRDGAPNHANALSYVALAGQIVNISDVSNSDVFEFPDLLMHEAAMGYRPKSMLVMPMKNHENEIIGVLQLFNATDPDTGGVISFSDDYVDLIASLTSQAAVALTNAQLIQELKDLFYSFIKSIATAIDAKSPYTGGHIRRVVDLSLMLAHQINATGEGPFADLSFNEDEIEELHLAAWMHDVGKITTPEHVVDKRTRLETIFDRIQLIETRFDLIRSSIRLKHLRKKMALLETARASGAELTLLDKQLDDELNVLQEERAFVARCNLPSEFMNPDKVARLEEIARKTYETEGKWHPYLTPDEVGNLSIPKGTITHTERHIIESHAEMTLNILKALPFPKKYANVPEFASSHHERLDGTGYPRALSDDQLPVQVRILAIADVFEALTAKDRPYKAPMKLSNAIKILKIMMKDRHIDPDLLQLFVESNLPKAYAERELSQEQIDED